MPRNRQDLTLATRFLKRHGQLARALDRKTPRHWQTEEPKIDAIGLPTTAGSRAVELCRPGSLLFFIGRDDPSCRNAARGLRHGSWRLVEPALQAFNARLRAHGRDVDALRADQLLGRFELRYRQTRVCAGVIDPLLGWNFIEVNHDATDLEPTDFALEVKAPPRSRWQTALVMRQATQSAVEIAAERQLGGAQTGPGVHFSAAIGLFDDVVNVVDNAANAVVDVAEDAVDLAVDAGEAVIDAGEAVIDAGEAAIDAAVAAAEDLVEGAEDLAIDLIDAVADADAEAAAVAILEAVEDAGEAAVDLVEDALALACEAQAALIDAVAGDADAERLSHLEPEILADGSLRVRQRLGSELSLDELATLRLVLLSRHVH